MTTHYSSISTVYAYNIIIQLFEIFQPFASQEICQGFILPLSAATTTSARFRSHAVVTSTPSTVSFRFVSLTTKDPSRDRTRSARPRL